MVRLSRVFVALMLLGVTGFCVFGFLATFEPLPPAQQWTWRVIYVVVGGAALAGAGTSIFGLRDNDEGPGI